MAGESRNEWEKQVADYKKSKMPSNEALTTMQAQVAAAQILSQSSPAMLQNALQNPHLQLQLQTPMPMAGTGGIERLTKRPRV